MRHDARLVLAVRALGEPLRAPARGHANLDGLLLLGGRHNDVDRAGHGHGHRVEDAAARLDLTLEDRDALAGLLDRRELVEEEVVAALGDPGDRFRVAGPHPERRAGGLSGRRAPPRQQVQRGRHLAEPGEVVLDEKGADEAERLGLDVELDEIAKAGAAVGVGTATLGLRTAEDSKFHAMTSLRIPQTGPFGATRILPCRSSCCAWASAALISSIG